MKASVRIGERLRAARVRAQMSQRALAEKVGVSHTAISKYERGLDVPGADVLTRLAQALGVKVEYFFRPSIVTVTAPAYRRKRALPERARKAIIAEVQDWLERYVEVERLFPEEQPQFQLPPDFPRQVASLEDVEEVALALRVHWRLGLDPLDNLAELLEDRGIKVGLVKAHDTFDALTLWSDGEPVIVLREGMPGDRQRFSMAHELGHLVLKAAEGLDEEKAANRFAAAFLVPKPVAYMELGRRRRHIYIHELHLLKHKYGMSMAAWITRARDLGIISQALAERLFREFKRRNWWHEEPGDPLPPEAPQRMKRLVMRALAEGIITRSRAAELLTMPLEAFWQEEEALHGDVPAAVCC